MAFKSQSALLVQNHRNIQPLSFSGASQYVSFEWNDFQSRKSIDHMFHFVPSMDRFYSPASF